MTGTACIVCGQCVDICCATAVELTGRRVSADEVMREVLADRAFYARSGGGVTLSGGEPVLQREFAQAILESCKREGLQTALETAGNCRWEDLAALLPATDLVMMDIKHMDPVCISRPPARRTNGSWPMPGRWRQPIVRSFFGFRSCRP